MSRKPTTPPIHRHPRTPRHYRSMAGVVLGIASVAMMMVYTATAMADKPGADKPGAARTDPRLAGIWQIESGVNNGKPIPADELEGARSVIRENAITSFDRDEKVTYRCVYTFDASKDPNTIDMVSTMPKDQDAKAPGIYKIEGDTWTLCYAVRGGERPTKFESPEGSQVMLLKMKRLKGDTNVQQDRAKEDAAE